MDLLARFVGIMMVFFIYIAVGVEGVAYDGACTGTGVGDCTDTNNICDATSKKCACSSTSYRKGGKECATKILLNAACTASQPADQCADALAECASGLTCVCKSGNFANKDGKCSTQILLNAACTASQPAGQCADALAECASGSTCACKSGNFENKDGKCSKQIAALDGPCDAKDPASGQCAVADAECRTNGTDKCLCKATHYTAKDVCVTRKNPKATCGGDECVTHASCVSTKCKCDADYTPSPTTSPTMCSGVVKFAALPYMYVVPFLVSMMSLLQ